MNAEQLIYKSCYDLCLESHCTERMSREAANDCLLKYQRNQFKKPHLLVKECVDNAAQSVKKK